MNIGVCVLACSCHRPVATTDSRSAGSGRQWSGTHTVYVAHCKRTKCLAKGLAEQVRSEVACVRRHTLGRADNS
jgi:hypothetical protein